MTSIMVGSVSRGWLFFVAALFCVQALTFLSYYRFAIEPFPPEAYDQAAYLTRVYELTAAYDRSGLGSLLRAPFEGGAQGVLLPFEGALLQVTLRLGRLAPLLLNFASLVGVELALFITVNWLTARVGVALAALGLFLSAHSMWFWAGGLFDFRIDWLASCLFGTWACLVMRSRIFEGRRSSVASALVAVVLILTRYICAVYVFGVESVLIAILLALTPWLPTRQRVYNGLLAMAITFVAIVPFVLDSITQIYKYYVLGHLTGSESGIRAAEAGVSSLRDYLFYYPISIGRDHLGWGFALVIAVFALASLLSGRPRPWRRQDTLLLLSEMLFLAGAIVGPIVVLTFDEAKSPVVGGILIVPIVLASVRLPRWLGLLSGDYDGHRLRLVMTAGGALCFAFGLAISLDAAATSRPISTRNGLFAWGRLITYVARDALYRGDLTPKIFFNTLSSHFFTPAFTAFGYEQTGSLIRFENVLGDSIFASEPSWIMERLASADYVVLTTGEKAGVFPALGVLKAVDPKIRAWVDLHLKLVRCYSFDGGIVDLYARS